MSARMDFEGFELKLYYLAGLENREAIVSYRGRPVARLPLDVLTTEEQERIVGRLALQAARGLLPE